MQDTTKTKRCRKPTDEERESYNALCKELTEKQHWDGQEHPFRCWAEILKYAANLTLTEIPERQKQPYIPTATWDLLEQRETALAAKDQFEANRLDKEIKKAVNKDKLDLKLKQLEEQDEKGYKWDGLKVPKKKFTPKFCKFKDKDGRHIPADQYAHKAADYLAEKQWGATENLPQRKTNPKKIVPSSLKIKDSPFEM